jgi:hypothetical protein
MKMSQYHAADLPRRVSTGLLLLGVAVGVSSPLTAQGSATCSRTISADVVALDQVFFWNRLGAVEPQGMIYALRRDVVSTSGGSRLLPGQVMLREGKRPRPLVLRMNVGDCLVVHFQNLLNPTPVDQEQPATRTASVHVVGLQLVNSILDDGSWVGTNPNSLVAPGGSATYTLYAEREGTGLLYSGGAMIGGEGDGGSISAGLFGAVNIEPRGSEWYRSQVTEEDLALATTGHTASGHPVLNYQAVYPVGHPFAGLPILRILHNGQIVHSDLTAIITGPNAGRFPNGTYPPNPVYPDRNQPFREFTIIFHDEIGAVQAFPIFEDPVFEHTTHSTRDAFAINYGTGGIGAEIIANRIGVGPMWDCTECKYEEFFLTSWAVGDPAMVVDVPANAPCTPSDIRNGAGCTPIPGPKATKAFFPDDPSNVYHSYLGDHVKFRNLHAGSDDHHIFHLHAHQWVRTPDSDTSAYLDSQAIGQGSSFNYEVTYNGGGNRNQTVGDAIFHCHFYPHFAQGMWSLWRVHDVLEAGTELDAEGVPAKGARALPDGEILAGTPIPAVVPLPTLPMAPLPAADVDIVDGQVQVSGTGNPGFPFFIPGVAGHRPPHPPLDTLDDGGLPRHVIVGGDAFHVETRLDFTKELDLAEAIPLAETGTPVELEAISFHATRFHSTFKPDGTPGQFKTNGQPARAGAPYADPCINDAGNPVGQRRLYKAADIQLDAVFNKKGWHFPQQRILSLWQDVSAFKFGNKPPEPLFFRANTNDCIEFQLTNLVPNIYELDDFQVRTPTDILGQHIHLVKFDVTASDGAANGFNYEDGSFSPDEVRERIRAIRAQNLCAGDEVNGGDPRDGTFDCPVAEAHPFFGAGPDENGDGVGDWIGAQTTVQRWYADETLDLAGNDRTLRTVFTHDHFGPSTHQQAGLYAGLVVEPRGSRWFHNETGVQFYTRPDGGPTSWQAVILTDPLSESYREFNLEFQDFALAYLPNNQQPVPYDRTPRQPGEGFDDPANAINPPGRKEIGLPFLYAKPDECPGGVPLPCPELVSADDPGMYSVNYRNEPLALRLRDPATNAQAPGFQGDGSFGYSSRIFRADPDLNVQPGFYPPLTAGLAGTDPFTPLLRTFEEDPVQIRILVGAHEEEHIFTVNGIKWLYEPSYPDSGWRNGQFMGISEHFEFVVPQFPPSATHRPFHDFLYKAGAAVESQWNGNWGIVRAYRSRSSDGSTTSESGELVVARTEVTGTDSATTEPDAEPQSPTGGGETLVVLPNNEVPTTTDGDPRPEDPAPRPSDYPTTTTPVGVPADVDGETARAEVTAGQDAATTFVGICPSTAPVRVFKVVAVSAQQALPGNTLVYNSRTHLVTNPDTGSSHRGPLHDPTAILFLRADDYDFQTRRLKANRPIEPLILRAAAGDCVQLTLYNDLELPLLDLPGFNAFTMLIEKWNANQVRPSPFVGLHPQLLAYDVTNSDGNNVGFNPYQAAAPGQSITYRWYAGGVHRDASGNFVATPYEFGVTGLTSSDPLKHSNKGAVGALIIEPPGAVWAEDPLMRASARVEGLTKGSVFREFVTLYHSDINLRYGDGAAVEPLATNDDPAERGQKGFNYRAEPIWFRMGHAPETVPETTRTFDFTDALTNSLVIGVPGSPNPPHGTLPGDPETPIFEAQAGEPVRFRVAHPAGHGQGGVFEVHGHAWQHEPYLAGSTLLGNNPKSEWGGSAMGQGPGNHHDALLRNGAGGAFRVPGDYLYRDYVPWLFDDGLWGLFRVAP